MSFSPETYAAVKGLGGKANGFASLNNSGKVPEEQLPSYVDDVLEGYYYNSKFYEDVQHTTEITGVSGKIYVDIPSGWSYRWSGTEYVLIGTGACTLGTISLSTTWTGSGPYTQTVTITGATITENSKIDIQPTAAQLAQLISDGVVALYIENNSGTLTATALGAATTIAMTLQVTVTEVAV